MTELTWFIAYVMVAAVVAIVACVVQRELQTHEVVMISSLWPIAVCILLYNLLEKWIVQGCNK